MSNEERFRLTGARFIKAQESRSDFTVLLPPKAGQIGIQLNLPHLIDALQCDHGASAVEGIPRAIGCHTRSLASIGAAAPKR